MKQNTHNQAEQWVDEHGDVLFRYALLRLGDRDSAEDMVQETFIAALRSYAQFAGQASERTWLIGILKNKVADLFRKKYREQSIEDLSSDDQDQFIDALFDRHEHWHPAPARWKNPDKAFEEKLFYQTLNQCIQKLPDKMSHAFLLRMFEQLSYAETSHAMNITSDHLGALLHRARLRLRHCLEHNWFSNEAD